MISQFQICIGLLISKKIFEQKYIVNLTKRPTFYHSDVSDEETVWHSGLQ